MDFQGKYYISLVLTTTGLVQLFRFFPMLCVGYQTGFVVTKVEKMLMCGGTCYITTIWILPVLLLARQPTMCALKDYLEEEELLDPLNDTDLFCVHLAILPEVNHCLRGFMESWNHHSLSTEHNMTPEQLFTIGMLQRSSTAEGDSPTNTGSHFTSIDLGSYNMQETSIVDTPNTPDSVCSVLSHTLGAIHSQTPTSDFGKATYIRAIHAVGSHIHSGCDECFC